MVALRMKFSQKILIQNVFLSHPQNIKWRYTLEHSRNYVETCNHESSCLGVDIQPLDGHVQLRFLMTKKRTLKMMECVEDFVDSEVLEAVQQRTDMVKMARMAIVEEMMEMVVLKEMKEAAAVAAAVAAVVDAAAVEHNRQRKKEQEEHARQRKEEQEKRTSGRTVTSTRRSRRMARGS
jgi:ribosomal protein L12E/L44/L45/RPP1/RPP2